MRCTGRHFGYISLQPGSYICYSGRKSNPTPQKYSKTAWILVSSHTGQVREPVWRRRKEVGTVIAHSFGHAWPNKGASVAPIPMYECAHMVASPGK